MHAVQISFYVDPERRPPETLLSEWYSLSTLALATASAGTQVSVIQASMVPGCVNKSAVAFHFVAPDYTGALLTRSAAFCELLKDLSPDVIHVHGLGFAREVCELFKLASGIPILLQDHADHVPRIWRRRQWRRGAAVAAGISFCAQAQAEPFRRAGLLARGTEIFQIPESTSLFLPGDAAEARAATGLYGDPAVLSVGHLDPNKDPLTVLEGFSTAARDLPNMHLWCCYAAAPLLSKVKARIASDTQLIDRVHLLDHMPHEQVELLMRAADLFVLGSHREGGNFSLIEAIATGLTPIVTDIPSSRVLTGNGEIGTLWPCGDSHSLSGALRAAAHGDRADMRRRVRAYFDRHLSGVAIGRKFTAAYQRLVEPLVPASSSSVRLS